jgi:hypothetical protein
MSACLAIDFGSAKIILLGERIKFREINNEPGPRGRGKGLKNSSMRGLIAVQAHFCHLVVVILKLMHPDGMINMPAVFPVPYFKITEMILFGEEDPEGASQVFDGFVPVLLPGELQFLKLFVVQGNRVKVSGCIPEFLFPVLDPHQLVFVVEFGHFSFKPLTLIVYLNKITVFYFVKFDHMASFLRI